MVKITFDNGKGYEGGKSFEGNLYGGEYEQIEASDRFIGGCYAVNFTLDVEILPPKDFEIFKGLLKKENPKIVLKEW